MRILIAEDDDGLGAVLVRGLREQGYIVDLVPDGETAASYAFGSNSFNVHLARLRAKLADGGVRIETVRSVGYRIVGREKRACADLVVVSLGARRHRRRCRRLPIPLSFTPRRGRRRTGPAMTARSTS